jgi:transcriptional regulator with XRE-family HTH domain
MQMLSKLIEDKLKGDGISIREAGRQVGVSATTISRILNDESIDVHTLVSVCRWMNVSPSDVIDSELHDERAMGSRIAAILQTNPELSEVFIEALNRLEDSKLDMNTMRDLISYTTWKLDLLSKGEE